jgi:hypothetical protein
MSSNDFWTSLIQGHTASTAKNALDVHLASVDDFGRAVGEDFEGVRSLTDRSREANALSLPIAAGTKVSFAGGLGAYLAYDDAPNKGALGEVVNVRSANGEITHHDGKVFVQWGDGKFRSVHAEHLRRVASGKTAMEHASEDALKKWFKDHPNMTKEQKSKHTVSKSEGGETPEDAAGEILGEDIKALPKPDDLKRGDFDTYGSASANQNAFNAVLDVLDKARGGSLLDAFDAINAAMKEADDDDDRPAFRALENLGRAVAKETGFYSKGGEVKRSGKKAMAQKQASDIKQQFEKIKALAEKRPDSDFLKSLLKQMADKGFAPTDKQMAVVKKIEAEAGEMATMQKELKGLDKKSTFRVSSVGDLTDFLKRADGKLIHKSTKDLWSFNKDADGALLVERLFDDSGEPLKG